MGINNIVKLSDQINKFGHKMNCASIKRLKTIDFAVFYYVAGIF